MEFLIQRWPYENLELKNPQTNVLKNSENWYQRKKRILTVGVSSFSVLVQWSAVDMRG